MKEKILNIFEEAYSQKKSLGAAFGIDELFLSALLKSKRGVSLYESEIDSVEIADEVKIGVWLKSEGRWGASSLERAETDALLQAISEAKLASQFADVDNEYSLVPSTSPSSLKTNFDSSIQETSMVELEKIAKAMDHEARQKSSLIKMIKNIPDLGVGYDHMIRIVTNSNGVRVVEENALLKAGLSVLCESDDGRPVNVHEMDYWTSRQNFNPKTIVDEVTDEALHRRNPQTISSGKYPIILDPRTAVQLLSTFWSVFSGDLLYRKLTKLEGQLEKSIASSLVNIVEDSSVGLVPHFYDAEGTPCQKKKIIEHGIFKTFLHNRYTAQKVKAESTGNAAGGIGDAPGVGPSTLFWDGKVTPVKELFSSVSRGIYIQELNGASASPISGDFSYGALGFLVENGVKKYPIADFTIAGNFFDLLKKIQALGDDLRFFSPGLAGSWGGRTLLVEELSVSGA